MARWILPPELDDMILDHLHNDTAALSQCARVRRSWLPSARHHLWRELKLFCSEDELLRFNVLLDSSPAISFYVCDVSVVQKKGEVCQWHDLHLLHHTLAALARLPRLDSLVLDGLWFGAPRRGERTPLPTFLTVRSLAVSTCSFDAFEDVQRLCYAFPALQRLRLDGVWWGRWAPETPPTHDGDLQIAKCSANFRELDLGSCFSRDKVIDWLMDTLPTASVETLRLPIVGAYDMRLQNLLAFVGPALTHLEIGSPSTSTGSVRQVDTGTRKPLESYLDLSQNTNLQTLALGVPTYRDPQFITLWLATVLAQVASTVLREVRFAVYPILRSDAGDAETMLCAFGWSEVVRVLSSESQFSGLQKVTFVSGRSTDYLQIPGAFVPLQPLLQKSIPKFFEALRERGVELDYQCI